MYVCVYVCVCVCVYVYVYVYVYVCIHIYIISYIYIYVCPSRADVRPKFHWGFSYFVICSGYISDCFRVCLGLV